MFQEMFVNDDHPPTTIVNNKLYNYVKMDAQERRNIDCIKLNFFQNDT